MWRKNRRYHAKYGCHGVDLNRNWGYGWEGNAFIQLVNSYNLRTLVWTDIDTYMSQICNRLFITFFTISARVVTRKSFGLSSLRGSNICRRTDGYHV